MNKSGIEEDDLPEPLLSFKQISSSHKHLRQIESLESRFLKLKSKEYNLIEKDRLYPTISQLGLLYNRQGLLFFQQNKPEKAEMFFLKAKNLLETNELKKTDTIIFLEISLIQNLGYLYKTLGKYELAFKEFSRFFEKSLSSEYLASKHELSSSKVELLFIMYGGICLKIQKNEIGLKAVLQGIDYLECFLKRNQWLKLNYESSLSVIDSKKVNLAYLYYLGSRFYLLLKNLKNLERALTYLKIAFTLSKEVYGDAAIEVVRYSKQLEKLKIKIDFEKSLISDLPHDFKEFCNGIHYTAGTTEKGIIKSSTHEDQELFYKSSPCKIFKRDNTKQSKQQMSEFSIKNFPLGFRLHQRNLTTLSTSASNNTQLIKTTYPQLTQISPLDIADSIRNMSDFLTQRPSSKKIEWKFRKTVNPQKNPTITSIKNPYPKNITTNHISYKTLSSFSSQISVISPEIPLINEPSVRIGKGLKHSISLKKNSETKRKKDRRLSDLPPSTQNHSNKFDEIEEENISIIGSVSELSESEAESFENNSSSKNKSSHKTKTEIISLNNNNTPKNEIIANLETNSLSNKNSKVRPPFIKKQTLELPIMSPTRSINDKSFSEKSSSPSRRSRRSTFKEEHQISLEKKMRNRVKSEVFEKNDEIINLIMKKGEGSIKENDNEKIAVSKFIVKVFKSLFLRKFTRYNTQKIKEIEENESPILKTIDDMKVFNPPNYSNFTFEDIFLDDSDYLPLKFYDIHGRIAKLISCEFMLFKETNDICVIMDQDQESLIPSSWILSLKIVFEDSNLTYGVKLKRKCVSELKFMKNSKFPLFWSVLVGSECNITDEKTILSYIIEKIKQKKMPNLIKTRTCTGMSLRKRKNNEGFLKTKINYFQQKKNKIYQLAVRRDVTMKDYFHYYGLEKNIQNTDISKNFSLFYENFSEKLPKITNLQQIFSPTKKNSPLMRRSISHKFFKVKYFVPLNDNNQSQVQSNIDQSNNIKKLKIKSCISSNEKNKNKQKPEIESLNEEVQENDKQIPIDINENLKYSFIDKENMSSIREVQAINSQTSFISRNYNKKIGSLIPSSASLRNNEKIEKLIFSQNTISESEDQVNSDFNHLNKIRPGSPRRKTMLNKYRSSLIPTIQSLFNLEDIEGSPKKSLSPNKKQVLSNKSFQNVEIQKKRTSKKIELLCDNKNFVESFFKGNKNMNQDSRYNKYNDLKGIINNDIFVEKPYVFTDESLIYVEFPKEDETLLVMIHKETKKIIEIRFVYKKQKIQKVFWVNPDQELQDLADSCDISIIFYNKNQKEVLTISLLELFDEIFCSDQNFDESINTDQNFDESINNFKYLLEYKCLRKEVIKKFIDFINHRLKLTEEGNLCFSTSLKKNKTKIHKFSANLNNNKIFFLPLFKSDLFETIPKDAKSKKFYIKIHLRNSAKYLRIEVNWIKHIIRLAFYDPLQGRKDYCLVYPQQKLEFENIERVLKQRNNHLKERILLQNLTYVQELVGKKLYIFREIRLKMNEPKDKTLNPNIKLILISYSEDDNLKKFFFKKIIYEVYKIRNLGKSYIKLTVYKPNKHFSNEFLRTNQILFKLEIYPFNKRFSLQKFIFNQEDFLFPDNLDNERIILTYLNQEVLNKLTYINSTLYKRLIVPEESLSGKYYPAVFAREMNFEKYNKIKDCSDKLEENETKFLKVSNLPYKIIFQSIKKLGKIFTIITFKKHLANGYWVIEIYIPLTNRTFKTFLRSFEPIYERFERTKTTKTWYDLVRRIRIVKSSKQPVLCLDNYRGIIRESLFEETIFNNDHGLIMTEWFIEKKKAINFLKCYEKFYYKNSQNFKVYFRIHFLNYDSTYNEKICLRDLIFNNMDYKDLKFYSQSDLFKIVYIYGKRLTNTLKTSFDLRLYKERALKTNFLKEDPKSIPPIRLNKDKRLEGCLDNKAIIILEKILAIKSKEIIGIVYNIQKNEFLVVVFKNRTCKKLIWKVTFEEIKEKIYFVGEMMKLKLYNELGTRILALVQNKIIISSYFKRKNK